MRGDQACTGVFDWLTLHKTSYQGSVYQGNVTQILKGDAVIS
jgi:hypothetical protein